jgi:hypothetical protein
MRSVYSGALLHHNGSEPITTRTVQKALWPTFLRSEEAEAARHLLQKIVSERETDGATRLSEAELFDA